MSDLERAFITQLKAEGLAVPLQQFQFTPNRKWRFDFAWPSIRLAVEIQGGTYVNGRHSRADGYANDCEKSNVATLQGWRVLRFSTKDLAEGKALKMLSLFLRTLTDSTINTKDLMQ